MEQYRILGGPGTVWTVWDSRERRNSMERHRKCIRLETVWKSPTVSAGLQYDSGLLYGLCPFIIIINSAGRFSVMKEIINYSRRVMRDERIMKD